ncbi:MAG: MBL fold metallo-hydrolase [Candidatus Omnitrophica bacterium]|nr:MBL fold metallo-hydrolase [Candidatus Omnitrophota bacterium]
MQLLIHRGTKEIGGICVELMTGKSRIIVDLGIPLVSARKDQPFDSKVIEGKTVKQLLDLGVLPAVNGLYRGDAPCVDAVLISHSHLDHYGLLRYVHPDISIFISEGAREMIGVSDIFTPHRTGALNARIVGCGKKFKVAEFEITAFLVDHSAFDALAFLIEANGTRVFYSGDFRGHGRKSALFKKMVADPPRDIDCLLMEGSMIGRGEQIYKDEVAVERGIREVLESKSNIAFLFASSQNIDRLVSAYKACRKTGTTFVIDLYTAFILHRLGAKTKSLPQFNWPNVRVKFFKYHADKIAEAGHEKLLYLFNQQKIEMEEINRTKENVLMILRDNSLFPKVIAHIHPVGGATIIYSMWEGYLTDKFKGYCREKGISIKQIHTSGHAIPKDLTAFAKALNPRSLVPIHTFHSERYGELFDNVKLLEDEEPWEVPV